MRKVLLLCICVFGTVLQALSQTALRALQDRDTEQWGFVDSRGNWAIKPMFQECHIFSFDRAYGLNNVGMVKYMGRWGCINRKGEFVARPVFSYDDAYKVGGLLCEGAPLGSVLFMFQDPETEKWGFVNHVGNWAIPPLFDGCHTFSFDQGFCPNIGIVKHNGMWGCINKKGEFVVRPIFSYDDAYKAGQEWLDSPDYVPVPASRVGNYSPESVREWLAQNDSAIQSSATSTASRTSAAQVAAPVADRTVRVLPPVLTVLSPENGSNYNLDEVVITYQAKSSDGQPVQIMVSVDNEPYDMTTKGVRRVDNELRLRLPSKEGVRRIQLMAKDSHGLNSEPVYLSLNYTGDRLKPTLHMLAVGVGQYADPDIADLKHAAKDAEDVARTIGTISSREYSKIESPVLLTDVTATAVNLKTALMKLAGRVQQDDVVFLYFSGHGAQENNETYFLTSDAVNDNLYATAVGFSDIRTAMRILVDKRCRVVVFMDACHAGALYDTRSVSRTIRFAQPGVIGFYSSTNSQRSNEADKWQNGVFTRALIDGLDGNAKDRNGNITTLELERYIKTIVAAETDGIQTPIIENNVGDFILL